MLNKNREREIRTFEDLDCWQACRVLRKFCSEVCKSFPKDEAFRLKDQILRSARRTTASIAEGYGRYHYQENIQYCRAARGSAYEVLDHFIAGQDESLISDEECLDCRDTVEKSVRLLNGYIRYLKSKQSGESH